jgi:hypothetical protein
VAKDMRHYAKFTLDFADNPKIGPLSDAAFRCLVEITLWSARYQTDGFVAKRLALARWSLDALNELCDNDADHPSLLATESGWIIHDYAQHQTTRAEIRARQEQARAAGQKGGLAKAKRPAKRTAKRPAKRNPSEPLSGNVAEERNSNPYGLEGRARETAPPNGAAPHTRRPTETLEEALARADRESREIF